MFCSNCGTQLPEDSKFCTNCGVSTLAGYVRRPKKHVKWIAVAVIAVAVCLAAAFGLHHIAEQNAKDSLQKELMRDWDRVEKSDNTYYTLILDFSDDEIEYIFDSYYVDDTIATYEYTVISGNQFTVDNRSTVYTVEFNDDKTMMTITPALTSTDSSEHWFHLDD